MSLVQTLPGRAWPGLGADYPGRPPAQPEDALYLDHIQTARISSADEDHGQLSDTGYTIKSGSWRVMGDAVEQWIECITAGEICRRDLFPYGTSIFEISKNNVLLSTVQFLSFDRTSAGSGYNIGWLADGAFELVRTGAATLARTAAGYYAADARYAVAITRNDADGEFTIYIRGGVYADWTLVDMSAVGSNPVTNNVWTTNLYWVLDADVGDRLYLDQHHAGVVAP